MIITTNHDDYPIDDLQEVANPNHADATSAIRTRPLARLWLRTRTGRTIASVLDTMPSLYAELDRLRARLARTLADLHNLIAAARATLSADADGEPDPLYYLRDELEAQGQLPQQDKELP